jgi:spermidine synthase
VCQIGFGGGRIPTVLHHYFPQMVIESTELDAEVVRVARRWFGVQTDERMRVFTEEGRSYLDRQPPEVMYDIILVDSFTGSGQHPYSLSTREFYELTRSHLTAGGVVATNLTVADPMFEQKVATMRSAFAHMWRFTTAGADVFFGSDESISLDELRENAELIFRRAPFTFPFVELLDDMHECAPAQPAHVLTDGQRTEAAADDLMFQGAGRNDPCPCGSGKKFKNCHGR